MSKLLFTKTHEWVQVEGQKGKIGLSEHAQKELGDLVFVELPAVGDKLTAGKAFMNVESVKAVSEVNSPVNGVVTAINEELEETPEKINGDAQGTWICEVEIESLCDCLMSEEEYKEAIK